MLNEVLVLLLQWVFGGILICSLRLLVIWLPAICNKSNATMVSSVRVSG